MAERTADRESVELAGDALADRLWDLGLNPAGADWALWRPADWPTIQADLITLAGRRTQPVRMSVDLNALARRWHTTHLASPLRCRRLWLQPGDWTAQTWAACALAPGHGGPCKHIDPLGRLAPIPPDHVEVP